MNVKSNIENQYRNYFNRNRNAIIGDTENTSASDGASGTTTNSERTDSNVANSTSLEDYGIFNMPHQFTPYADVRLDDTWMGRTYKEHIAVNAPTVIFKIGKPAYMKGSNTTDQSILSEIMELDTEDIQAALDEVLKKDSKKGENSMYYYTWQDDFDNYAKYVNALIRYTASKMNLGYQYTTFDIKDDTKFRSNSWWKNFTNSALELTNYIAFCVEASGTSVSESGSNSTTDSQLASGLKTMGQSKRELDFLFGTRTAAQGDTSVDSYQSMLSKAYSGMTNLISKMTGKLSGMFTSVSSGANVLFPQIWSDSEFTVSASINIKLESPYGDKESVFRNVYIPFYCLLAMALPRMSGKQGYVGPFLIQCASKGWFSLSCAMVSSIDVKKAGSGGLDWNVDSMPTSIEVSLNMKDMYPTIIACSNASKYSFGQNIGLTEYLKVMSGVLITDFDPVSNLKVTFDELVASVTDIPTNLYTSVTKTIGKPVRSLINTVFGGYN